VGAKGEAGTTKCGNPLPKQGQPTYDGVNGMAAAVNTDGSVAVDDTLEGLEELRRNAEGLGRTLSAVNVTSYGWVYVFPASK
jgi:hypothetical protein